MTEEEMYDMYRLLAIAKYDERYVIPPAHAEQAHSLEELATECALDYEGGPGMGGSGPFGEGSGAPTPIAVENFAMLKSRQTADTLAGPAGGRGNAVRGRGPAPRACLFAAGAGPAQPPPSGVALRRTGLRCAAASGCCLSPARPGHRRAPPSKNPRYRAGSGGLERTGMARGAVVVAAEQDDRERQHADDQGGGGDAGVPCVVATAPARPFRPLADDGRSSFA